MNWGACRNGFMLLRERDCSVQVVHMESGLLFGAATGDAQMVRLQEVLLWVEVGSKCKALTVEPWCWLRTKELEVNWKSPLGENWKEKKQASWVNFEFSLQPSQQSRILLNEKRWTRPTKTHPKQPPHFYKGFLDILLPRSDKKPREREKLKCLNFEIEFEIESHFIS